jgi:hypothetical protein
MSFFTFATVTVQFKVELYFFLVFLPEFSSVFETTPNSGTNFVFQASTIRDKIITWAVDFSLSFGRFSRLFLVCLEQ